MTRQCPSGIEAITDLVSELQVLEQCGPGPALNPDTGTEPDSSSVQSLILLLILIAGFIDFD